MIQLLTRGVRLYFTKMVIAAITATLLFGCADYAFKFNNRTLYTPPPLFADYSLPDPGLESCVQQTIEDQEIHEAGELTTLVCTSAGIESLKGLETFTNLAKVDLRNNPQLDCIEAAQLQARGITVLLPEHCLRGKPEE